MTYNDYICGRELDVHDHPFYGLIQAAMRRADTKNLEMLKTCWPEIWDDLQKRYNAPGGRLEGD